jgi:hypothetical protein
MVAVLNRERGVVESLGLPEGTTFVKRADAQLVLVFLFVKTRAELESRMPPAVAGLGPGAATWVFLPQGVQACRAGRESRRHLEGRREARDAAVGNRERRRDVVRVPPAAGGLRR